MEVTHCYGQFKAQELDGVGCIDFLPDIKPMVKGDMRILKVWKKHFKEVGTPYLVLRCGKFLKLWKENRAVNPGNDGVVLRVRLKQTPTLNEQGHSCHHCGHFQKDDELCPNCGADPTNAPEMMTGG